MEQYTDGLKSGMSKCRGQFTQACVDRLGNYRQKDSDALIFSSAGTLNRWNSIDGLKSGMSKCCGQSTQACVDRLGNYRQKDSNALIFSSAGTLNRWNSIQMA